MSPPILPQEILDAIIDLLAQPQLNLGSSIERLLSPAELNAEALKACSLVSHAFAHRAQPYIFSVFRLSTDAEMTDEEKVRRIERRTSVVRLFEQKPHIMRGIRGISIDLVCKDDYETLFRFDTKVDNDMIHALKNVPNTSFLYAHGGSRKTKSADWRPYLRLHLLPLNFTIMTTLVISEFKFDFAVVAFMPSLCHFSMTSVKFIPDADEPPPLKPPPNSAPIRLFIREFELTGSRDDMLDVVTDNVMGTGPQYYPILDFSRVRSVKLGDHDAVGDDESKYLSSLWRLLGYCAHSVENLVLSNRYMCNYKVTTPFIPVGETELTTFGLQHMARLHSLTLKARPINLLLQTGHDALRDVIHLINSLPADNQVTSITLIFDIDSKQELSFHHLIPYADWDGLVACLDGMAGERQLTSFRFFLDWTFVVDDVSSVDREHIGEITTDIFRALDQNVVYALNVEPHDILWSADWNAVES